MRVSIAMPKQPKTDRVGYGRIWTALLCRVCTSEMGV